jgi:hypothetical protein
MPCSDAIGGPPGLITASPAASSTVHRDPLFLRYFPHDLVAGSKRRTASNTSCNASSLLHFLYDMGAKPFKHYILLTSCSASINDKALWQVRLYQLI